MKTKKTRQEMIAKGYAPEIVEKALAKAARWMNKAFGEADWNEIESDTIEAFCKDTLDDPSGRNTFNRGRV